MGAVIPNFIVYCIVSATMLKERRYSCIKTVKMIEVLMKTYTRNNPCDTPLIPGNKKDRSFFENGLQVVERTGIEPVIPP